MKLEVGKTYRTRNGEKVEIVQNVGSCLVGDDGCTYFPDGRWIGGASNYDLISEWEEPSDAAVAMGYMVYGIDYSAKTNEENMELSELEKKHAELGAEIAKLKALQVAKEEVLDFTWFVPEVGEEYSYIGNDGELYCKNWWGNQYDKKRLAQGNCYRTERCGDVIAENKATATELKKLAGDFVPDWSDGGQDKWYVSYDFEIDRVYVCSRWHWGEHPYFRTESDAQEAADKVGHERIKQLRQYGVI